MASRMTGILFCLHCPNKHVEGDNRAHNVTKRGAAIIAVGIAISAVFLAVVYSGFSMGGNNYGAPSNPFGPGERPPRILMLYQGEEYEGELLGYVYGENEVLNDLPRLNLENVTTVAASSEPVPVAAGSTVQFRIEGNMPPEAQHDSLSITLYDIQQGEVAAERVISNFSGSESISYNIDPALEKGQEYVLESIATWLPDEGRQITSGYVTYGYSIVIRE